MANGSRLPLFVMMTCLNGYYEGTGLDSLAESVLKAEGDVRPGDAVRRARHATADRDVRRAWVFLGDPSNRLR